MKRDCHNVILMYMRWRKEYVLAGNIKICYSSVYRIVSFKIFDKEAKKHEAIPQEIYSKVHGCRDGGSLFHYRLQNKIK